MKYHLPSISPTLQFLCCMKKQENWYLVMSQTLGIFLQQQICEDMWSSSVMEPYLSYSVHFIDDNWRLQTRWLQTLFVPKDHTADNLCDVLTETLAQWKLEPARQVCITTDNGSNIKCATTAMLMWIHLPCFGYNLHLAVVNSTKDDPRVQRTVGLCRKLVSTFSHRNNVTWQKHNQILGYHSIH